MMGTQIKTPLHLKKKQKKTGGKQTSLKLPKCFSPFLLGHLNVKVILKKAQGEKRVLNVSTGRRLV